uniref:Uncharacterized protein n=1 Tax=Strigamia maritima TaxID=126957 RepID=T1IX22_STRMM
MLDKNLYVDDLMTGGHTVEHAFEGYKVQADISYKTQHPILLSPRGPFVMQLLEDAHDRLFYTGSKTQNFSLACQLTWKQIVERAIWWGRSVKKRLKRTIGRAALTFRRCHFQNQFWQWWRKKYLLQLQSFHMIKPTTASSELKASDVIILHQDKIPRRWPGY